jgi:hypothetical protein
VRRACRSRARRAWSKRPQRLARYEPVADCFGMAKRASGASEHGRVVVVPSRRKRGDEGHLRSDDQRGGRVFDEPRTGFGGLPRG